MNYFLNNFLERRVPKPFSQPTSEAGQDHFCITKIHLADCIWVSLKLSSTTFVKKINFIKDKVIIGCTFFYSDQRMFQIKFLKAGCADGIVISFKASDEKCYNIIVDGGIERGKIYGDTLRVEIEQIYDRLEKIDLWIITHIDDDHIGGILRFLNDSVLMEKVDISKTEFWFNYSIYDYDTGLGIGNLKSVKQGIRLREYLLKNSILKQKITEGNSYIDFHDAKITILSPNKQKFEELLTKWQNEEVGLRKRETSFLKASRPNDYSIKLKDFDLSKFTMDDSEENASSIAFLFEFKITKVLFLSDSHPSVITDSLKRLGFSMDNKLHVDYMQVAHHGSKGNTSDDLLQLIDCKNFIISGDGYNKSNLPNKVTIARILENYSNCNLFITHKNDLINSIFDVDKPEKQIKFSDSEESPTAIVFNLN